MIEFEVFPNLRIVVMAKWQNPRKDAFKAARNPLARAAEKGRFEGAMTGRLLP